MKEGPIILEVPKVPKVHVIPLKAVKDHPKVLAKKSVAVQEDFSLVLKKNLADAMDLDKTIHTICYELLYRAYKTRLIFIVIISLTKK